MSYLHKEWFPTRNCNKLNKKIDHCPIMKKINAKPYVKRPGGFRHFPYINVADFRILFTRLPPLFRILEINLSEVRKTDFQKPINLLQEMKSNVKSKNLKDVMPVEGS